MILAVSILYGLTEAVFSQLDLIWRTAANGCQLGPSAFKVHLTGVVAVAPLGSGLHTAWRHHEGLKTGVNRRKRSGLTQTKCVDQSDTGPS